MRQLGVICNTLSVQSKRFACHRFIKYPTYYVFIRHNCTVLHSLTNKTGLFFYLSLNRENIYDRRTQAQARVGTGGYVSINSTRSVGTPTSYQPD